MTHLCLTTYNFPSFTHTTGMKHFLDLVGFLFFSPIRILILLGLLAYEMWER